MTDYKNWWHVTTPYVDAYSQASWVNGEHTTLSKEEFEKKMHAQASMWGEQGLGSSILRGVEVPRTEEGNPVLAIGSWDNKMWAVIPKPGTKWFEVEYNLIEFAWPKEWDVT